MPYLEFLRSVSDENLAIPATYNPILVGLSIAVAVVAAFASLGFADALQTAETRRRRTGLLAAGSLTMGSGIWAMHFIGMMALRMPMPVGYDLRLTLLSVLPGCLASAAAIRFISSVSASRMSTILSGIFMGSGIAVMHFTGMAAMRMSARIVYDPSLFVLSGVVAISLAVVALHLNQEYRLASEATESPWPSLGVSSVLGGSVAGMHYTGMAAALFLPDASAAGTGLVLDPAPMSLLLALTTAVLISLALWVVRMDKRVREVSKAALTSRQRLNQALANMSEGFSLWDVSDRLVVWNSKFRDIHQLGAELAPGMTYEALARSVAENGVAVAAQGRVSDWVEKRLAEHRDPSGPRIAQVKDGRWFQVNERKTANGDTVALYTDITLLKNAERELGDALEHLKRTQAQLVQSEKMAILGQLTAGLAHEFNTPVGAVQSSADILDRCARRVEEVFSKGNSADATVDATRDKTLGIIRDNVRVITDGSRRISDLLSGLKGFTGLDQSEFRLADLRVGLDQTLALLAHEARERVELVTDYGFTPKIYCIPSELNQVFMTVIRNAIRSVEQRGTVTVRTYSENGRVTVCISDTGKGISEQDRSKLFDLVFARKGARIGLGIGLYQARTIVEKHGGRIDVESVVGEGSRFLIHLPADKHPPT